VELPLAMTACRTTKLAMDLLLAMSTTGQVSNRLVLLYGTQTLRHSWTLAITIRILVEMVCIC
jgi:hypothetical protein